MAEARKLTRSAWYQSVKTGIARPVAVGVLVLVLGVGGFGAWAATAPLQGAVIAPAKVAATGRNKQVQHLEGGIVKSVLVEEGDRVEAGDALIELDATAATSQLNQLRLQLGTLRAIEARLLAQRNGAAELVFPPELSDENPDVQRILEDQQAEFGAALSKHGATVAILEQQLVALDEQIGGHQTEKDETVRQIGLVAEERGTLEALLEQGLSRRSQVIALERAESELRAREGQLAAAIAEARQSIAQANERIAEAETVRVSDASSRLSETRFKISETLEQLTTAEDTSSRTIVRAPASGIVIDLANYGVSAVLAPGQNILSIVPDDGGVIIEARVRPQDIDQVRLGQSAWLSFSALDPRETPPVKGEVVYVSADRHENERTGEIYYVVRLEIADEPGTRFDLTQIGPGYDVEVFITTGERTFFDYLTEPFLKTIDHSFRES